MTLTNRAIKFTDLRNRVRLRSLEKPRQGRILQVEGLPESFLPRPQTLSEIQRPNSPGGSISNHADSVFRWMCEPHRPAGNVKEVFFLPHTSFLFSPILKSSSIPRPLPSCPFLFSVACHAYVRPTSLTGATEASLRLSYLNDIVPALHVVGTPLPGSTGRHLMEQCPSALRVSPHLVTSSLADVRCPNSSTPSHATAIASSCAFLLTEETKHHPIARMVNPSPQSIKACMIAPSRDLDVDMAHRILTTGHVREGKVGAQFGWFQMAKTERARLFEIAFAQGGTIRFSLCWNPPWSLLPHPHQKDIFNFLPVSESVRLTSPFGTDVIMSEPGSVQVNVPPSPTPHRFVLRKTSSIPFSLSIAWSAMVPPFFGDREGKGHLSPEDISRTRSLLRNPPQNTLGPLNDAVSSVPYHPLLDVDGDGVISHKDLQEILDSDLSS